MSHQWSSALLIRAILHYKVVNDAHSPCDILLCALMKGATLRFVFPWAETVTDLGCHFCHTLQHEDV